MLLTAAAALPIGRGQWDRLRLREGEIARERVVAPYDFPVQKDEAMLRREQEEAATAVPPVLVVDAKSQAEVLNRWATFHERALATLADERLGADDKVGRLRALGVTLEGEAATAFAAPGRARRVLNELGPWISDVVRAGVVAEKKNGFVLGYRTVTLREGETEAPAAASRFFEKREALDRLGARARSTFIGDPRAVQLAVALAQPFVQPTVMYDRAETDWRRVQAQGAVPRVTDTVKKDELIVDANQRVTHDAVLKLRSLRNIEMAKSNQSEFLYPPVARMLLMLLFIAAFLTYLRMELLHVYRDNGMLAMFTLLTLTVLGSVVVLVNWAGQSEFTVPLALAPLVVASLLEKRPALVFTLMLSVLATAVAELRAPFVPVA